MAFKIPVVDRIPTYPGRVKLTPVSGQTNTYDLERADLPIEEGTPINKALFDSKAYGLSESVTVYVSKSGSDTDGDGSSAAPFLTVQKAVDSLPKVLNGFHAQVDIASGTYNERVLIDGFIGGRFTLGVSGRSVILRGITIMNSNIVRLAISNLSYASGYTGTKLYISNGSNVYIMNNLSIDAGSQLDYGIALEYGSTLVAENASTITVSNCGRAAIMATLGSLAAFAYIAGSGNTQYGLAATFGGIVTYLEKTISATSGDYANRGGRIFTGGL